MNATNGNSLLVLKFNAENISTEDYALNMADIDARFKIIVNGEEKNALTTMLLNDMAFYQGILKAGENKELVLVCEIPTQQCENISSLELMVKNVENTATISFL